MSEDGLSLAEEPRNSYVWLLAAIGAIGVGIGVFAFRKGSKIAGTVCLLTNIPVLAYYGFIAFFFATGGSR